MTSLSFPFRFRAFPALLISLCLAFFRLTSFAQEASRTFDIPAGKAEVTLKQFADQAGAQFFFSAEKVAGVQTNALKGELVPSEALNTMLAQTPLVAVRDDRTGAYTIRRSATVTEAEKNGSSRPAKRGTADDDSVNGGKLVLEKFEVFGSKSINLDLPRSRDDAQPYVVFDREQVQNSQAANLQDFFMTRLPMATDLGSNAQGLSTGGFSSLNLRGLGASQTLILVDGRRLPGRVNPIAGSTFAQADLNGIPLAMIERIEILPSTASGIYGGGATGGVINIITRKDFVGAVLSLNYTNSFDTDSAQRRADLTATWNLRGGATVLTLTSSYATANALLTQDRDLTLRARQLNFANNPAAFTGSSTPPLGYTSNIASVNGSNLVLKNGTPLNSRITSVPVDYAGTASDGGTAFVANAGRYNLALPDDLAGGRAALFTTASPVKSLGLGLRQKLLPWLEGYADYLWTKNRGEAPFFNATSSTTLAATAPNNPFTTAINVRFPSTALENPGYTEVGITRLTGGLVAKLPGQWQAGFDYAWSRSSTLVYRASPLLGDPDGASGAGISYATALSSGVLDVTRDLNAQPLGYAPYVMPGNGFGYEASLVSQSAALRASGPVFHLPAGDVVLSTSAEWQKDNKESTVVPSINATTPGYTYTWYPEGTGTNRSIYAEARVPLLAGSKTSEPARLEGQLAVRYDGVSRRFQSLSANPVVASPDGPFPAVAYTERDLDDTTYTAGLRYAVLSDLTLRGSWGTGFLAPAVSQLSPGAPTTSPITNIDPKRGGTSFSLSGVTLLPGGSPDLRPEHSESFSAGLIFTPRVLPGFRVSIDYTRIDKTDEIVNADPQVILNLEDQLPGRVQRAALTPADQALGYTGGIVTLINNTSVNLSRREVESVDFQADYTKKTSRGEFRPYVIATWMRRFVSQATPTSAFVDAVGFSSAPLEWRGNAGLDWRRGAWSAGWNTQYYHDQFIYSADSSATAITTAILNQGANHFPSQFYHDVHVRYQFGAGGEGWRRIFSNLQIGVGLQNVFDKEPPLRATTGTTTGYQFTTDPRLRRYTLNVQKRF